MSKHQIFIDGSVGTTGLRIQQRLEQEADIALLRLPESARKDLNARLEMVERADLTLLCLPDDAARELVAAAPTKARICDASTAHRTHADWVYGLPEVGKRAPKIAQAKRVAIPGCHATGFLMLVAPLVEAGLLSADYVPTCHSLTGYSGGGKMMIADYESQHKTADLFAPRLYGLTMQHKHLPEMQKIAGLNSPPLFCPVVDDYYSGMLVSVPLPKQALAEEICSQAALFAFLQNYYQNQPLVRVRNGQENALAANALAGQDHIELFVLGNETQFLLCARFDNLGKGASGAAIQCMNLMLGRNQTAGLQFPI